MLETSEDVLATDWTLSDADITTIVSCCRGNDHRLRLAIQLCALRATSRFLSSYDQVPLKAANYLAQQLECHPVLFVPEPVRPAIEYDDREQIRRYLGYRPFTDADENALVEWMQTQLCNDFVPPAQQVRQAEEYLRAQRFVLPAPGPLRRLIASALSQGQQALYERIAGRLSDAQRQALEALIAVEDEHTYAALTEFKRSPAEPSAKQMRKLIDRHEHLVQLGIPELDLSDVNPDLLQRLAQLARCHDDRALRRIEPSAKRYALLSCFLFEAAKTLLDHIIEMNDRLLMAAERTARHRFEEKYRKIRRRARRGLSLAVSTLEALLNEEQPRQVSVAEFLEHIGPEAVRQAVHDCRTLEDFEQRGSLDEPAQIFF